MVLAVPVGEIGKHQVGKPVGSLFVERFQDPGLVGVAGVALQESFRLFPPVPAEVGMEQIDHGPQVASFFNVDLEQVAEVILGGTG